MTTRLLSLVSSLILATHLAVAGPSQPAVVLADAVNYTPQLVQVSGQPIPHVDGIAIAGSTMYAGGVFTTVIRPGSRNFTKHNFVAFDANTGAFRQGTVPGYVDPAFNGAINDVVVFGSDVYVGGAFTVVNGISRVGVVKINGATGAVDTTFNAGFSVGQVWDLQVWFGPNGSSPMLIAAGGASRKLVGLNLATGVNNGYFNPLTVANPIPNAWGGLALYKIGVNSIGTKLAATGNFMTVNGQPRTRFFMVDLTQSSAVLDPWYYPGFAKPCSSTDPRRLAYLSGVDFSPDDNFINVTATGQIPTSAADIWPDGSAQYHTVCDGAGRFALADPERPVWINYTGGDSVWSTVDTGAAVYVQGHFKWLDNPNGFASQDGGGASPRFGVGAIDPVGGKALPWAPYKASAIGGKNFLATTTGIWFVSDSSRFGTEAHRGIAFAPLPP
jgi:hypothetical protein